MNATTKEPELNPTETPERLAWPALEHATQCRKADLQLRLDWQQQPEVWCRSCGRHQTIDNNSSIDPQEGFAMNPTAIAEIKMTPVNEIKMIPAAEIKMGTVHLEHDDHETATEGADDDK